MHVMITANTAWTIYNFRRNVVEAIIADGHQVTILASRDSSTEHLCNIGANFYDLGLNAESLSPAQYFSVTNKFKRFFIRLKPDVVLSYTIKNNIFGGAAAASQGIPFIPNVTGLGTAFLSGKILQFIAEALYKRSFRNCPAVFFQNEDDLNLFVSRRIVSPAQVRLLPGSGIDLEKFQAAPLTGDFSNPVFLMVSRLIRDKGVLEFVEAARRIKSTLPNARFQILGSIDAKNRSAIDSKQLNEWVDEGYIEYLGTASDVRPHIVAATCVVLPSYREGAPRSLIEAAAMSRPVITTDVPGCRAVVDRDVSGFLCEAKNAESLTQAIRRFIALNANQRIEMGRAGRRKMQHEFDQSIVEALYLKEIKAIS